ncbi:capsular polysaccharide biosynthesis protein [Enterovirga sp.]|uniref:capsular polysaccharide biosynthesis protein n=1 Tax=Enterovirga sp. TaxID=2026350 RepID=UPI00261DFF99|nr:capsular polysaccharide biosynthesis protein [Enterovirga sp.]MDB5589842.1 Capsule polysaccharide biosynthesis protein [Enterovirga sp.]
MSKLKRIEPRTNGAEEPPKASRRRQRLASEPTSRRIRPSDRWEAGFLRLPAGSRGRPLSYVVDGLGIYYDATAASELETVLQEGGWQASELMARAEHGTVQLRRRRLSLCNDPRRIPLELALERLGRPRGTAADLVVVIDQPREDLGPGFALAGPERFRLMLDAARAENPDSEIVVVRDPAAPIGSGQGHLEAAAAAAGIPLVSDPVESWSVAESCRRLYCVAAHVGFEAALARKAVTCFGVTFYSGWGFTDDRLLTPRRTSRRSVTEVFAAAYLLYSRYFEPYEGRPIRFEQALDLLELVRTRHRENAIRTVCFGFAPWKTPWLGRTLGAPGFAPRISTAATVTPGELRDAERAVVWSSRSPAGTDESCRQAGIPLLRMEDGFLRSIGLGVGLRQGASYVLDGAGVYYDATGPSDLERLLETGEFDAALLDRARALRELVVGARLSKYNVGTAAMPPLPPDRRVVLVAGQVEDDASIARGETTVAGNLGLLRRARERHPEAYLVYKPHPDVEAGLRPGYVPAADLAGLADLVLRDVAAPDAIDAADQIEVATSLLGFEALLRGKPVATHGLPFYAGWGLTESPSCPRRTRRLSLDELVAGALILYPRYVDPPTGLPCTPEVLARRLRTGDPKLTRRERRVEGYLKQVWSFVWRRLLRP